MGISAVVMRPGGSGGGGGFEAEKKGKMIFCVTR